MRLSCALVTVVAIAFVFAAPATATHTQHEFIRGDVNIDGNVDNSDVVVLGRILNGQENPKCKDAADVDDDGAIGPNDLCRLITALFGGQCPGGIAPPNTCGEDETCEPANLGCDDSFCSGTYEDC